MSLKITEQTNEFLTGSEELSTKEHSVSKIAKTVQTETCHSIGQSEKIQQLFPMIMRPKQCAKHKKGEDILCLTDKKLICSHCALFDYHANHKFILLDKARSQATLHLEKARRLQKYQDGEKQKVIEKEKKQILKEMTEKKQSIIKEIKKQFYKFYHQLESIESEHYKTIHQKFTLMEKRISAQFETLYASKHTDALDSCQKFCDFYTKYIFQKEVPSVQSQRAKVELQIEKIKQKFSEQEILKIKMMNGESVQEFCENFIKLTSLTETAGMHRLRKIKSAASLFSTTHRTQIGAKDGQNLIIQFLNDLGKQSLDLSGYDVKKIPNILSQVIGQRQIPRLKLSRMNLTDEQWSKIIPFVNSSQFVNLSSNELTELSLQIILKSIPQNSKIQSINLSKNKNINPNTRENKLKVQQIRNKLNISLIL